MAVLLRVVCDPLMIFIKRLNVMEMQVYDEVITKAVGGDQSALERLLLGYYDRLASRIARKIPSFLRNTVTEEDILQETFIEVFQRIESFEMKGERAFYRWLVTIADHRLLDLVKAHQAVKRGGGKIKINTQKQSNEDSVDELIELLAGPQQTPSRSVARHEAAAAIQAGLVTINEDYRYAIQLRYFDGLSPAEVGKIMSRSPHAVHNLCHRGLKELRAALGRSSQYFTHK